MTFPVPSPGIGNPVSVAGQGVPWADAINYLQEVLEGPLTPYTALWTAVTTNPVINNGSIVAGYKQFGPLVFVSVTITMGSTTTYGSGGYSISAPVATSGRHSINGVLRTTGSFRIQGEITGSVFGIRADPAAAAGAMPLAAQGTPATLASGHSIQIAGWYPT
jgi:hypothetical protein